MLLGALGAAYGRSEAPYDCPWGPYGCSEAAFGSPWGCVWLFRSSKWPPMGPIWLLRGSKWLPMGLHMAAQRLHLAAEGLHFVAQGPSVAPVRQICSICCVWLGQAGQPGFQETAQAVVSGRSGAPNPSTRMREKASRMNNQGSSMRDAQESRLKDARWPNAINERLRLQYCFTAWWPKGAGGFE